MQPEIQSLMEELQTAFNESVCESDKIAAVLAEIKSAGYDVLLALEVTIGVTAAKPDSAERTPETVASGGLVQWRGRSERGRRAVPPRDEDRRRVGGCGGRSRPFVLPNAEAATVAMAV